MRAVSIILGALPCALCAQGLTYTFNDNSQAALPITDVRSVTLASNGLKANLWNGTVLTGIHGFYGNNLSTAIAVPGSPDAGLLAYPNPATGQMLVEWEVTEEGPVRMELVDATGRAVWRGPQEWRALGRHSVRIDRYIAPQGLTDGLYTLRISERTRMRSLRIQWQ